MCECYLCFLSKSYEDNVYRLQQNSLCDLKGHYSLLKEALL